MLFVKSFTWLMWTTNIQLNFNFKFEIYKLRFFCMIYAKVVTHDSKLEDFSFYIIDFMRLCLNFQEIQNEFKRTRF
jgi:hypothetical protein